MGRTQDPGGDYGYDEVHADLPAGSAPAAEEGRPGEPPLPRSRQQEPSGDYGYDEAHDF